MSGRNPVTRIVVGPFSCLFRNLIVPLPHPPTHTLGRWVFVLALNCCLLQLWVSNGLKHHLPLFLQIKSKQIGKGKTTLFASFWLPQYLEHLLIHSRSEERLYARASVQRACVRGFGLILVLQECLQVSWPSEACTGSGHGSFVSEGDWVEEFLSLC